MKHIQLGNSDLAVSNVALGCMRMAVNTVAEAEEIIQAALDSGINFFDHADIYGRGESEAIFGQAMKNLGIARDSVFIQSKVGIVPGVSFDFRREHILKSVDDILERLQIDYLDALLLHRPDTLFDPKEVAQTFDDLYESGKVRQFGVSNQNPGQIELLKKHTKHEIVANQLQFSIMHSGMIDAGFNVNMTNDAAVNRDGGILEYCRLHNITIQAWSPFQHGYFGGVFLDNEKFPELNVVIDRLAEKYEVTNTAIAVAWILRHPSQMQVIIGTMTPQRIADSASASEIELTHEEWYEIYLAAGNVLP